MITQQLTEITKTNILDELLIIGKVNGKLELLSFLNKIWDLEKMPSKDPRFSTASKDIWQHMVMNNDMEPEELYLEYFALQRDTDEMFFKFIKNYLHPLVRINLEETRQRVEIINRHLKNDGFTLEIVDNISNYPIYEIVSMQLGVQGEMKNIIFASSGAKPEIILKDAINNDIEIVKNQDLCLIYDKKIKENETFTWSLLSEWWAKKYLLSEKTLETERKFYKRLEASLNGNTPEITFFSTYYRDFKPILEDKLPALIPQVYLHYDPKTIKELAGEKRVIRQRMDFLMLLPNKCRIVLEIDGMQHYTTEMGSKTASSDKYAEMVKEDRRLKLIGYEVYRFGGYEFFSEVYSKKVQEDMIKDFFTKLFKKYGILESV